MVLRMSNICVDSRSWGRFLFLGPPLKPSLVKFYNLNNYDITGEQ